MDIVRLEPAPQGMGAPQANQGHGPGRRPVFRVSHCIGDFIMSVISNHEKHAREPKMNVVLMVPESFGVKKQFNTIVLMPRIPATRRNFEVMVRIYGAQ